MAAGVSLVSQGISFQGYLSFAVRGESCLAVINACVVGIWAVVSGLMSAVSVLTSHGTHRSLFIPFIDQSRRANLDKISFPSSPFYRTHAIHGLLPRLLY